MKLKKIAGLIAGFSLLSFSGITAFAEMTVTEENQFTDGVLAYEKISNGVAIVACDTTVTEINIQEKVNGYDVIEISDNAFYGNSGLVSVSIPDSVKTVGKYAFSGCAALEKVELPEGLTQLSEGLFANCQSLTDVEIPDTVTVIGMGAFMNCIMLSEIELPDGVISLEDYAFNNCYGIKSLELPANLENIGPLALGGLYSLTDLTIAPENDSFKIEDDILYDTEMKTLYLSTNIELSGELTIPDTVTSIEGYAFSGCSDITSVTIPESVIEIGADAFSYCSSLKEVNLSEGLESIGSYAFNYNESLETINLPTTLKKIGVGAFANDTALTSVIIPEGVTSIGSAAFFQCTSLNNVSIPSTVETIGEYAFGYTANSDSSDAELQSGFSMSVFSDSAAKEYAKNNNINYDVVDFNLKTVVFIVICVLIILIAIVGAVRIMKKSKPAVENTDDVNIKENNEFEDGYKSIVDDNSDEV